MAHPFYYVGEKDQLRGIATSAEGPHIKPLLLSLTIKCESDLHYKATYPPPLPQAPGCDQGARIPWPKTKEGNRTQGSASRTGEVGWAQVSTRGLGRGSAHQSCSRRQCLLAHGHGEAPSAPGPQGGVSSGTLSHVCLARARAGGPGEEGSPSTPVLLLAHSRQAPGPRSRVLTPSRSCCTQPGLPGRGPEQQTLSSQPGLLILRTWVAIGRGLGLEGGGLVSGIRDSRERLPRDPGPFSRMRLQ